MYVIMLQVLEAKAKLETMQMKIKELEKERHQMQEESKRLEAQAKDKLLQEMVRFQYLLVWLCVLGRK